MTRKFNELYEKLPAASRARVEDRVREYQAEMALEELRRVRKMTQVDLARNMGIAQGAVSKIEKRQDMHVGTLRKHIEAMGGSLQLRAVFPDGEVPVRLRGESAVTRPKRVTRAPAARGKKKRA